MIDVPPELAAWRARGSFRRVLGHEVFTLEQGDGPGDPLLVLHGFPSSSFDFHFVLDALSARRRVVLHDHLGFGLSSKPPPSISTTSGPRWSYSLIEQAEVAIEIWRALGITRGHVLAHDYGTSVATELCARRARGILPIDLASLTLCNGSVHIELADLTLSQHLLRSPLAGPLFARLSRPALFKAQVRRIFGRPDAVSDAELDLMWAALARADGVLRLPAISAYLDERRRFHARWIGALERLDVPAHVLWGRRDPVAVPAIAAQLAAEIPGARLTWLDDLGHYPMLEDPARWASAALAFLDALPGGAPS